MAANVDRDRASESCAQDQSPTARRARDRYRLLLWQICAERRGRRGWKRFAAAALGVSTAFVSLVMAGKRDGELHAICRAIDLLGLDHRFFFESFEAEPPYRNHLRRSAE